MQLCKGLNIFSQCFTQFLESTSYLKHFGKEDDPHSLGILKVADCERYG